MVPKTQIDKAVQEEGLSRPSPAISQAGAALPSRLSWLPRVSSSDAFPQRCRKLAADLKTLFQAVPSAFAQAPDSEHLLWLRNNEHQLTSAARLLASELGAVTRLPHVWTRDTIVPRALAIAEAFVNEAEAICGKAEFIAYCSAFEETTPLEFHEIGALVPALKLVLLEQISSSGAAVLRDPACKPAKSVVSGIRAFRHVTQTS